MAALWILAAGWSGEAFAGTMKVHVLDVGQGDSVLIVAPNGDHILVDSGTKRSDIVPTLRALGVDDLELVVASHPHADHIGGMEDVVRAFHVDLFIDNGMEHTTKTYAEMVDALDARAIPHRKAKHGEVFEFDDLDITVLWPGNIPLRDTRSDLNSNSVVLRLDHGESCVMLTGDAEEPTERALLSQGIEQCDALKVAHHGSNHSSSDAFLRAVDPDIALISCGQGNRYKHPGEDTTARLASAGAVIYRTDTWGILSLESDGETLTVSDGSPVDPALGWLPRDTAIASTSPGVQPSLGRGQEQPTHPETEPSEPAVTPPNLSGVRPSHESQTETEPTKRFGWRIREWLERRRVRRSAEKE